MPDESGIDTLRAEEAMDMIPKRIALLILALAGALVAGCETTPPAPESASITDEVVAQATVVAIDKETREVTLERTDGAAMVVVAGPEVRNFDQIEVGHSVNARLTVSLSARRLKPEEVAAPPSAEAVAARAAPGEMPAGAIAAGVTVAVTVKSVDKSQHLVVFTGPEGELHAVEAERDEGRRFVAGLKPGDRVELSYAEALAISVE